MRLAFHGDGLMNRVGLGHGRALGTLVAVGMLVARSGWGQAPKAGAPHPFRFQVSASVRLSSVSGGPFGPLGTGTGVTGGAGIVLGDAWYLGALGSRETYAPNAGSVRVTTALLESRFLDAQRRIFNLIPMRPFYGIRAGYVRATLTQPSVAEDHKDGLEIAYLLGLSFPAFRTIEVQFVTAVLSGQFFPGSSAFASGLELGVSFRVPR